MIAVSNYHHWIWLKTTCSGVPLPPKTRFNCGIWKTRWVQMIATLANVKPGNFLKAFWTSRHGRVQKTNLFEHIKKEYDSVESAVDLSVEMLSVAEQYTALENSEDLVWTPYPGIRETIRSLKLLGA